MTSEKVTALNRLPFLVSKSLIIFSILFVCSPVFSGNRFFRVLFNEDANHKATIIWDQYQCGGVHLYLDSVDHGQDIDKYPHVFSKFKKKKHKGLLNYSLELDSLKAGTIYYFIVKDDEGLSRRFYFETTPKEPDSKLLLIAGGDSRTQRKQRQEANLLVSKLKPHAILFAGDFTASDIPHQWEMWFEDWELTIGKDGRITPLVVARGNHEHSNGVMQKLFNVPNSKVAFNVEMGDHLLNVIALNTESKKKSQTKFLSRTLNDHECYDWQIPMYHRPVRPHVDYKPEGVDQYNYWVPQFEKSKNTKLVIESDAHTCKRTWPILKCDKQADGNCAEGFVRDDAKGIVYIGEGCWGAPARWPNDPKPWTRDKEQVYSFKYIFVAPNKIEVRTVLYMLSNEVKEVDPENRFQLPENLKFWTPENGPLIEIKK